MRVLGVTLPDNKRAMYSLTALYGIGLARAISILQEAKVDPMKKVAEINEDEENRIRKIIEAFTLEGDLKREVSQNVKRLKDIQSYRGSRHARHLPVRGQRTKTNSRTVRGNKRVTMGSGRRVAEKT